MDERWMTDWEPSQRFPFYTRANSGEVAPRPLSPLNWMLVFEHGAAQGWADGMFRWGAASPDELDPARPEVVGCFGGYLYLNWSMLRVYAERTPGMSAQQIDEAFFGAYPNIPLHVPHPDDDRPDLGKRLQASMDWMMGVREIPAELAEDRAKALELRQRRPDLATATDSVLAAHARSISPLIREFFEPYTVYGICSSTALSVLQTLCASFEPGTASRLISGLGDIDSATPSHAIWDLSRMVRGSPSLTTAFDAGLDGLLDRLRPGESGFVGALERLRYEHGARGPVEWDIRSPTWETRPELVVSLVDRMRLAEDDLSPTRRHLAAAADRAAAEAEVRVALAGDEDALARLDLGLRLANVFVTARERTKLTEMLAIHEVRVVIDALGRRMTERGFLDTPEQITMLLDTELDPFIDDPASFEEVIRERETTWAQLAALRDPFIVYGHVPPLSEWGPRRTTARPLATGDVLTGVGASPGVATGRARVITDPIDPRGLEPGEILVAPLTDPAWTPLFIPAAGVVVEVGAPMSHAMIVSREFGIPCVTGIAGASLRITDGALIQVDGSAGTVTVLDI